MSDDDKKSVISVSLINIDSINFDTSGLSEPGTAFVNRCFNALYDLAGTVPKVLDHFTNESGSQGLALPSDQMSVVERVLSEAGVQQRNIDAIILMAAGQVSDDAEPEKIEADWLRFVFERCRNISDEIMRKHWAALLAEEANSIGSFSKRSIACLAELNKEEAELFAKLCQHTVHFPYPTLVMGGAAYGSYPEDSDITKGEIFRLDDIGLVKTGNTFGFSVAKFGLGEERNLRYFDRHFQVGLEKKPTGIKWEEGQKVSVPSGTVFSGSGRELSRIVDAKPNEKYLDYLMRELNGKGLTVTEVG